MSFCLELKVEELPRIHHGIVISDMLYALVHQVGVKEAVCICQFEVSYRGIDFGVHSIEGIYHEEFHSLGLLSGCLAV